MKTKILGSLVLSLALILVGGTASAAGAEFLQPASIVTFDEAVDVNSSLKAELPTYFSSGMIVGQQMVGGVSYLQGTLINTTTYNGSDVPLTIGDNARIDGVITRGEMGMGDDMPVWIDDHLRMAGNIEMQPGMTVDGVDVSELRINDWDEAYGWGNHALQGYLTVETDPIWGVSPSSSITDAGSGMVVTVAERTNWDAAFGWGDHALAGYLTTETDPLAVLKTDYTASGDLLYGTGAGTYTDLTIGSSGQVLTVVGGVPTWEDATDATHLVGSKTWDPANMGGLTQYITTTVAVTGAALGDTCTASHTQFGSNDLIVSCQISASDTAKVLVRKQGLGGLNMISGTLNVDVWTH